VQHGGRGDPVPLDRVALPLRADDQRVEVDGVAVSRYGTASVAPLGTSAAPSVVVQNKLFIP
jgi:hypothetical protein